MASGEGKYNIKAVSKILGIQPGTLRAWERRYKIISPKRNEAGHRLYTDEHVAVLRWLLDKIDKGFTISQAIDLLESGDNTFESFIATEDKDRAGMLADEMLSVLLRFDEKKAQELLNQAFALFSIEKVVLDILANLLVKVGHMWENNKITVAHEHFTSAFLRSRIGMIFHTLPVDGHLPKVVAVCGPEEEHELGLLIFTLYLRRKGFEVIYLGSGIPKEDISVVIEETNPTILFLSCTLVTNLPETLSLVDELKNVFPDLKVGLGGSAVIKMPQENRQAFEDILVGTTREEWDSWLKEKLSR
ncbi:MerR family transcriptional regulator [Pseudalkalibacillus caeni]|uniref:MerR family transcriptional regulator n=1 Tax=Exobacillus caeni TaxID=2574798 RepID=A0A5R9EZI5_9BACL|nr:cobalamin-dependent protein [Pseudalkalibacillus caeni]TLS35616.1 MerR family transcriptional regulator [Pseudalkalibacillus caeni]